MCVRAHARLRARARPRAGGRNARRAERLAPPPGMLGRVPDSCWDELGMALGHLAGTEWVNGPGRNPLGGHRL